MRFEAKIRPIVKTYGYVEWSCVSVEFVYTYYAIKSNLNLLPSQSTSVTVMI